MIGFLSLPIRLLGIVFMAAFCARAMAPLRSLNNTIFDLAADPSSSQLAAATEPAEPSSLLGLGISLVAIISIWLIYQTLQQQMGLAKGELRNRRAAQNPAAR